MGRVTISTLKCGRVAVVRLLFVTPLLLGQLCPPEEVDLCTTALNEGVDDGVAGTYYVNAGTSGASDTNDGQAPTLEGGTRGPWLTIRHAVTSMRAGDVTYVLAGTYRETDIPICHSGTSGTPIVLQAFEEDEVIIDCSGGGVGSDGIMIAPGISHITIDGLSIRTVSGSGIVAGSEGDSRRSNGIVIRNMQVNGFGAGTGGANGITLCNADNFTVDNVHTSQGGVNGILLNNCTNGTVTNSTFRDNPAMFANGLEIQQGHDIRVSNCTAYNHRVYGFDVSLWPKTPPVAYNITIEECLAYGNGNAGFAANSLAYNVVFSRNVAWNNGFDPEGEWGGFVCYGGAYDVTFQHNVAIGNRGPGFLISIEDHDQAVNLVGSLPGNTHTFANNIAHNNTKAGLHVEGTDQWNILAWNNNWNVPPSQPFAVINMTQSFLPAQIQAGAFGTGNISTDPRFVDVNATPPDVHLQADSPCIDAGTLVDESYVGTAPDMGRFEFTGE